MSLRRNIIANYASQVYVAIVGLAVTPWYLRHLGAEAYGLVGFFGTLFAWFQLLDIGLSPVVMREVARYRAGAMDDRQLWLKIRAVEGVFLGIAILAAAALFLASGEVATRWLGVLTLDQAVVMQALKLMALTIGLRFASVFYRGIVTGLEQLTWLAGFNSMTASLRAFCVLPAMLMLGATPCVFFGTQLAVGVLEIAILMRRAHGQLPPARRVPWRLSPLRDIWRFSMAVAFTGGIGVAITQSDRLILSGMLDLKAYGHFSLAALAASAISLVGAPLGSALQPRFARQAASANSQATVRLFRLASHVLAVLTLPVAMVLAMFGGPVLQAWTGSVAAAPAGAATLALYALGNAVAAQLVLPYSLQFAAGRLRRHVLGNALLVLLLVPGQILLTRHFGAVGAASCWLAMNVAYAVLWIPFALRPLELPVLRDWYLNFVKMLVIAGAVASLARPGIAMAQSAGHVPTIIALVAVGVLTTVLLAVSDASLRLLMVAHLQGLRVAKEEAR